MHRLPSAAHRRAARRRAVVWVLVAAAGLIACGEEQSPGYEYFMPDMVHSVAYESFAPNPVTDDGKTLRLPAEGTIPRGHLPFHYGPTPEEAERAGLELTNPFPADAETLARGQLLYESFCQVCHGPQGKGDGPLVPPYPAPPAYTDAATRLLPPGRIFHAITHGVGNMPSYAGQISAADRWRIVHVVTRLQQLEEDPS